MVAMNRKLANYLGYRSRSNGLSEVKGTPPDSNILWLGIEFEGE
jgi:hypothetical protein